MDQNQNVRRRRIINIRQGQAVNGIRHVQAVNAIRHRLRPRPRRNHRPSHFLPKRPKKPSSGYGLFLQEYWEMNNPGGGANGPDALRQAVGAWKALNPAEKQRYNDLAEPRRLQYQRAMEQWKATRKALRRPPSAYGLFLKETWERERGSGRTIAEMGRYVAGLWAEMDDVQRRPYQELYRRQTVAYNEEIQNLYNGWDFDLNWREKVGQQNDDSDDDLIGNVLDDDDDNERM